MYEGTTPTIPLTFKGIDLREAKIYLTIENPREEQQYTFTSGTDFTVEYDGENSTGSITLTQQETLDLGPGDCYVQARYIFENGTSGATKKTKVFINPVLLKEVISYV